MSWVLPTYNREPWLSECIRSIQYQSVKDIEIIVLDDGSTDHTPELMGAMAEQDPRISYTRFQERRGAAACRNYGNRIAKADYIHVVDAGDHYAKHTAKFMLNFLKKHPEIEVVHSGVAVVADRGQVVGEQAAREQVPGEKPSICHPTVVYSRRVAETYRYRELSLETDLYESFFGELLRDGVKFGLIDKNLVAKRIIEDDTERDIEEARRLREKVYAEFGWEWPFRKVEA